MPRGKKVQEDISTNNDIKVTKKDYDFESERQLNEIATAFAEGFVAKLYSDGIIRDVTIEQIQQYLANPDNYIKEMSNLAMYYYISDGAVFQLFDLAKILPTLNYKVEAYDKTKNYEQNLAKCNKMLNKVKHKQLTRDLISQEVSVGTVTGIWLGDKKNPYLYIFEDVTYFYPNYRLNGDWVVSADLSYLNNLNEDERDIFFKNLNPYITKQMYENYKNDSTKRVIDLPQDRTICLRTHTIRRNQNFGINWSTSGLFDLGHKKKLKDLEKAIANKIISAIAVLTIGNKEDPEHFGNLKLNSALKKKIYGGVKAALEKNQTQGVTVIGIPEFADIKFPEMKSDALQPDKFESINNDITSAYGTSNALLNGTGSNYSSAKINLDIFYKKLSVLLEDIETEVYGKLFKLILPSSISDDFQMIYDKTAPLSTEKKLDYLIKLHSEGYALKPIVDCIDGVDYQEYINQSIYEIDVLKLRDKIIPPMLSYTTSGKDNKGGRPVDNDPTNDSTIRSKTDDGNSLPE